MDIFEKLKTNKGTVSSALGKELAKAVLDGDTQILSQATQLVCYDLSNKQSKSIRAGAAKIVELVAQKQPALVTPYLESLMPALKAQEPQTRWMVIMTLGYCAKLNPDITSRGIDCAQGFIMERSGICLSGAAERYLGYMGAVSPEYAQKVLPILLDAFDDPLPNEIDWVLEGMYMIVDLLPSKEKKIVCECAQDYEDFPRPATQKRAKKIIGKANIQ